MLELFGFLAVLVILAILGDWFRNRFFPTQDDANKTLVRGTALLTRPRKRASEFDITIGGVPISDEEASKHIAFAGAIGTGKSNSGKETMITLVRRVEERGDLVICIDSRAEYMSMFGSDADDILNPFDGRSVNWNPFAEVRDPRIDFRMLARSLYPAKPNSQPEWDEFGKNLMANVLMKLAGDRARPADPREVLRLITLSEKAELDEFLKGTSSSIMTSADNSRMFASVRSTLSQALDTWFILNAGGSFSIREWVKKKEGGFLWIPYMPTHRASLEYLIAGWIDLAINEILSLGDARGGRKIWLFIDETTAIGKIPSLIPGLTMGRRHGLTILMAFQSVAQFYQGYGQHEAQTIISNARTKLVLSQGSHLDAQFWAEELGKREDLREERSEGNSSGSSSGIGHSSSNSGSNNGISYRYHTDHIVMPSELQGLHDNTGFLRIAGEPGIRFVRIPIHQIEKQFEPYVPSKDTVKPENVSQAVGRG